MLTNRLDNLALTAAKEIHRLLDLSTLEHYTSFLNTMYHYTLHSGDQLSIAGELLSDHPKYSTLFKTLSTEEESHYRLAQKDLFFFNEKPTDSMPLPVLRMEAFWKSIKKPESLSYIGIMYILENIAKHIDTAKIADFFTRLQLNKKNTRFISVHLHEDDRHGKLLELACQSVTNPSEIDLILSAGQKACSLWMDMHSSILTKE
ncbi:iron-containing redox enzyme family protein [Pseudomonas sp. CVAP|uniref:iron-containing redox enzyme family protein n=1 Tax=Pseudomonas sp. CVAP\|nr:iron-containing redox enzyme family protein [Pseudomonas sp. CVAP\